jgi:hypothetical protein
MASRLGHGGGENCTLSYQRDGVTRAYRLRCTTLTHGLAQVAAESHARRTRAYYPHRRSQAQFMATFALRGRRYITEHSEYERFNVWLKAYMEYILDQDQNGQRGMLVTIPARNFSRQGVPLGPVQFGEHVGSMLWLQTVTFETTFEPLDTSFAVSEFKTNGTDKDKNARFFYPPSRQLSGNQKPDVYDTVQVAPQGTDTNGLSPASVPSVDAIQAAVSGTGGAAPAPDAFSNVPVPVVALPNASRDNRFIAGLL